MISESNSEQVLLQLIRAASKPEVDAYQREEDEAVIAALKDLSPDDARDLILEMAGREAKANDFHARMREIGWHFSLDTSPDALHLGQNEHGFPIIGSVAEFPGGSFSIRINDIARVIGREEMLHELSSPK
ncbi:MAG: hypothetical protein Q8L37_03590 [Candidatus Gottesmanbacteria bacterium]|nr:hypothetical protein [Candidatus Gottesmanbacteria bacterium]